VVSEGGCAGEEYEADGKVEPKVRGLLHSISEYSLGLLGFVPYLIFDDFPSG
jgi:hypothetical protein